MQQLFVCHKLLLVFAFSPVLLSVIFLTALCCSKKKKKIPTTSLKSEILQQEDSQTIQVTVKEPPAEVSVPASTKDKVSFQSNSFKIKFQPAASSKVVNSTVIPVEKTVQKSPSSTEVPQGAKQKPSTATSATSLLPSAAAATKPSKTTKTLKKSKEQGKVAETGKKKVSSPVAAPPNTKKGKDVISLVPMSPSTPTSVPTVSSKDSSGTSKNLTDTPKTATADASGSSAIFEVEEDSSDVSIGKKRKSAAIRAQEDGPEDEMTDPGSYHTLADMNVDKVFKRVG